METTDQWQWLNGNMVDDTLWLYGSPPPRIHDGHENNCMIKKSGINGYANGGCGWEGPAFICQKGRVL